MAPPPSVSLNSTFKSLEDVTEWPKKLLHLTFAGKFGKVREATLRDNLKRRFVLHDYFCGKRSSFTAWMMLGKFHSSMTGLQSFWLVILVALVKRLSPQASTGLNIFGIACRTC